MEILIPELSELEFQTEKEEIGLYAEYGLKIIQNVKVLFDCAEGR